MLTLYLNRFGVESVENHNDFRRYAYSETSLIRNLKGNEKLRI